MIDTHVLDKICAESGLKENDLAIEIGPELGSAHTGSANVAKAVVAVEIDKFVADTDETLADYKNTSIINADF